MRRILICTFVFLAMLVKLPAQDMTEKMLRGYTPPDELVTLSSTLPYNKAIELINAVSEKKTGKKVISIPAIDKPIGIEIINVQYEKALLMIVQYLDLVMEKKDDATVIKSKVASKIELKPETFAELDAREVKISAVFFEFDLTTLKQRGINWQLAFSKKGFDFSTGVTTTGATGANESSVSSDFNVQTSGEFGAGGFFGEALSLFRFFETENLGEIIASPTVTVRDRTPGNIQVGSDFSIKQRDFAGNIIDNFYSTGSIIEVTPYIYSQDSIQYVLLDLTVERSSGFPSELSTEIRKTRAKTQVLMLNGEETIIGGLFLNEEKKVRTGIPYLKDLPWWVLGIRYLTGSDQVDVIKKELVIVIKIEMLPTLRERFAFPDGKHVLESEVKGYKDKLKYYQFNPSPSQKKDK